jgi:hypothetical protein
MTAEQIDLLMAAARKVLADDRYHFLLNSLIPLIAAVLGWFGAYLQFKISFNKGLKKEHYYQSKQNVSSIIRLHNEFLNYIYESYKSIKTTLNTFSPVKSDFMLDFVTEFNFKLAMICQMSRVEFPGESFDLRKILDELKKLENSISKINERISNVLLDDTNFGANKKQSGSAFEKQSATRYREFSPVI